MRLAELQENSARHDLTGAQRKQYAAEVGRLLTILQDGDGVPNGQKNWLAEMALQEPTPENLR